MNITPRVLSTFAIRHSLFNSAFLFALLFAGLSLSGCSRRPRPIARERATEIARAALVEHGWKESEIEFGDQEFRELRWLIFVWRVPSPNSGYAIIEISPAGRVINYVSGT